MQFSDCNKQWQIPKHYFQLRTLLTLISCLTSHENKFHSSPTHSVCTFFNFELASKYAFILMSFVPAYILPHLLKQIWNSHHYILIYATVYSLFPTRYTAFLSMYNICYPLSSTCFRPHRPIIRRSKLYMQPMVFSPSADVFVVRPLRKNCPIRRSKLYMQPMVFSPSADVFVVRPLRKNCPRIADIVRRQKSSVSSWE